MYSSIKVCIIEEGNIDILKLNTAMDSFEVELFVMYLLIVIVVWFKCGPLFGGITAPEKPIVC